MNISLTPELEQFVQDKVSGGMYGSSSEVIRESLRIMHAYHEIQQRRISELHHAIDLGMQQLRKEQTVNGEVSRKKMKRKVAKLAK